MFIIGIDPGMSGGIAVIPLYAFYRTQVFPLAEMTLQDIAALFEEFRNGSPIDSDGSQAVWKDSYVEVFLEEPQLPMMNVHTGNNFNVQAHKKLSRSLGQLEGLCNAFHWQPNLIGPRKWQKALNCMTGGDKKVSRVLAQKIFYFLFHRQKDGTPKSIVTDQVADALLIALYGYIQYAKMIPNSVSKNIPIDAFKEKKINPQREGVPTPLGVRVLPPFGHSPPSGGKPQIGEPLTQQELFDIHARNEVDNKDLSGYIRSINDLIAKPDQPNIPKKGPSKCRLKEKGYLPTCPSKKLPTIPMS